MLVITVVFQMTHRGRFSRFMPGQGEIAIGVYQRSRPMAPKGWYPKKSQGIWNKSFVRELRWISLISINQLVCTPTRECICKLYRWLITINNNSLGIPQKIGSILQSMASDFPMAAKLFDLDRLKGKSSIFGHPNHFGRRTNMKEQHTSVKYTL